MENVAPSAPGCPGCGEPDMPLDRVLPRFGPHPELRTFKCDACGEVQTMTLDSYGGLHPETGKRFGVGGRRLSSWRRE
jgi:hypothetical protein